MSIPPGLVTGSAEHDGAIRFGLQAARERLERYGPPVPPDYLVRGLTDAVSLIAEEGGRTSPRAEELFVENVVVAQAVRATRNEPPLRPEEVRLSRNFFKWLLNDYWQDY